MNRFAFANLLILVAHGWLISGQTALASDASQSRSIAAIIGDDLLAKNVMGVRASASRLSPDDRYEFLANWVLPNASRETFRLNGEFTPLSSAPPVASYTEEEVRRLESAEKSGRSRVLVGGSLLSPAIELVALAKSSGRLTDLRDRINAVSKPISRQTKNASTEAEVRASAAFRHSNRARLAMLALIELADNNFEAADEILSQLCNIARPVRIRKPDQRWPEMLAFWAGVRHRETIDTVGQTLYQYVFRDIHSGPGAGSETWTRQILALMGFKYVFENPQHTAESYFAQLPSTQWDSASFDSAYIRGSGFPGARWMQKDREIVQVAGQENDFLYFQSPLRGDFEVSGLTTTFDWRETELFFAGRWIGPGWGMTQFEMGDHRRTYWKRSLGQKMSNDVGNNFHIRIVGDKDQAALTANGRELLRRNLTPDSDPWIGARVWHRYHGGIRDIRISGTPDIPESINLLHDQELTGWAAYYSDANMNFLKNWRFDSSLLVGNKSDQTPDIGQERLLRYHRPMLEDGTIEYEFLYEPDNYHVHPTLDRLTFLLQPQGVKVHWCTDGIYDRTALSSQNEYDEIENRRGPAELPLNLSNWNRVRLVLKDDTVDLLLNGQLVYQRKLEPSNMRRFGLFHDPGKHQAQVRNVVWTGNWPKQLPLLKQQDLVQRTIIDQLEASAAGMQIAQFDFRRSAAIPQDLLFKTIGPADSTTHRSTPDGLNVTQTCTEVGRWQAAVLSFNRRLVGDFDVSLTYTDLKLTLPEQETFPGLSLHVTPTNNASLNYEMLARRYSEGHYSLASQRQKRRSDQSLTWDVWLSNRDVASGTLRLIRRGSTLYYFYAQGDSKQFLYLKEIECVDTSVPEQATDFRVVANGVGTSSVVIKTITIRAESIGSDAE